MPELLFEVWRSAELNMHECGVASQAADDFRAKVAPDAQFVHSFRAASYNAGMAYYDQWNEWEPYQPSEDVGDHVFTDQEAMGQGRFLQLRNVG